MFCFIVFDNGMVDQCFRDIIGNQFCPDFLPDILRFIRMKVAESNGIFKFPERAFNGPSCKVNQCYLLRREFISRQICDNTFTGIF